MRRRDRQIRLCAALLALNLCFIWGNSLLPAELSRAFSSWVMELLTGIPAGDPLHSGGTGYLRKLAHFSEFAVLGLLLSWLYRLRKGKSWKPLAWGIAAACIDETIQMFVPGRGPGLMDVGIDACGVLTGMLVLPFGYFLWRRNQKTQYGG